MRRIVSVLAPLAAVTRPKVYGIERIPDGGSLFVGNHTIFGFLDLPFMMAELYERRGIIVRGLGDHAHYAVPVWRDLLTMSGMVRGTRENVRALMRAGEHVLVFPGGAREVFKKRGERYRLMWKERLGFARLAIEHGYPVVPFAAVGAEEMLDVVADDRTPVVGQISQLAQRLVGIPLPPIVSGVGPTPLPRPERLYFWFGEAIDTSRFASEHESDEAARAVRDEARRAVEHGIAFLLRERDADPNRGLAARLRRRPDRPALERSDPDAWFVRCAFDAWNTQGPTAGAAWMSRWAYLEDPPDRPDAAVWRGRDAVLGRLEEVSAELGGHWARIEEVRSVGEDVLVVMELRSGPGDDARSLGRFQMLVTLEENEIVRIRVLALAPAAEPAG